MRFIKTLGLAAMAATAAMAFVGISSALATTEKIVLCEEAKLECEKPSPNPTEIHLEAEDPIMKTSISSILCESSLAHITLLNELAKLIIGHLLSMSFSSCKLGGTSCTFVVNEVGGLSLEALGKEGTLSTARVNPIELLEKVTIITVKCGALISCTYGFGEETVLTAHSDSEGHFLLLAKETKLARIKGFCPAENKWTATYHAVNLDEELTLKTGLWIEG